MKKCLLINSGSSGPETVKISIIKGLPDNSLMEPFKMDFSDLSKDTSYRDAAKIVAPSLQNVVSDMDFILFRCPAWKLNVLGPTLLTEDLAENFSEKVVLKHGSEFGFWLAYELMHIWKISAFFSRGIPTDMLPDYAKWTGHPEIKKFCLSHWEAVEGTAQYIANLLSKKISEISMIFVMLGSGTGIYGWERGRITSFKIRQWEGPMSPTSVGGLDPLALVDYLIKKGVTSLEEARKMISALTGSKGGFQLYNPLWLDLREFKKSVDNGDKTAEALFEAWVRQILGKIGEVKFSMDDPKSKTPVYFSGGGVGWSSLVYTIMEHLSEHLFSKGGIVPIDPENLFFVTQAKEIALIL